MKEDRVFDAILNLLVTTFYGVASTIDFLIAFTKTNPDILRAFGMFGGVAMAIGFSRVAKLGIPDKINNKGE